MTNSFHGNQLAAAMMLRSQGLAPNMPGFSSLARRMSAGTSTGNFNPELGGTGIPVEPNDLPGSDNHYVDGGMGGITATPGEAMGIPRNTEDIPITDLSYPSTSAPASTGRPWYGRLAEGAIMASPLGPLYGLYKLLHKTSGPGGTAIPRAPQDITFTDIDENGNPIDRRGSPQGLGGHSFVFNPGGGAPTLWQSSRGSAFLPGGSHGYQPMGGGPVGGGDASLAMAQNAALLRKHLR